MHFTYPVVLDLYDVPCLVVGGGPVAERKARALLEAGAQVRVVAPDLTPGLSELPAARQIAHRPGAYRPEDLDGARLVIAATNAVEVNGQVAADGRARGVLVNVVNAPESGNFLVPAAVRRGDLTIAVSTGGRSPLLARKIREQLEKLYGPDYAACLELLGAAREEILNRVKDSEEKQALLEQLTDETISLLAAGRLDLVKERLNRATGDGGTEPPDGAR